MYVKDINTVKDHLDMLKSIGLIKAWELPYENLLTRLNAAIFFMAPSNESDSHLETVWAELEKYPEFSYRLNAEKKLSSLPYRITFSKEEKEKNLQTLSNNEA
jgi:hypothetical protein